MNLLFSHGSSSPTTSGMQSVSGGSVDPGRYAVSDRVEKPAKGSAWSPPDGGPGSGACAWAGRRVFGDGLNPCGALIGCSVLRLMCKLIYPDRTRPVRT